MYGGHILYSLDYNTNLNKSVPHSHALRVNICLSRYLHNITIQFISETNSIMVIVSQRFIVRTNITGLVYLFNAN